MGIFFSKKKKFWVPDHRKMADKTEDLSRWKTVQSRWPGMCLLSALLTFCFLANAHAERTKYAFLTQTRYRSITSNREHDWVANAGAAATLTHSTQQVEDYTGWQIQNEGNKLGEAIAHSKATAEVNLSYNGLGDEEMTSLACAIKTSKTLKRLILANNHIHETGAQVCARSSSVPACRHTRRQTPLISS